MVYHLTNLRLLDLKHLKKYYRDVKLTQSGVPWPILQALKHRFRAVTVTDGVCSRMYFSKDRCI